MSLEPARFEIDLREEWYNQHYYWLCNVMPHPHTEFSYY